jgi:hypothetical protein
MSAKIACAMRRPSTTTRDSKICIMAGEGSG